ncbi:hypothetical protein Nepgr_024053 [Nepenthes gracilis]|uniref:Transcription repressor n=1 Tax=Nepenthes gracilis TaxID=150966 RepID=A0AAD3T3P2_NEPGR|nr:hypothetical protein Nepgr_024053 [Nepenthes gracilis]
MPSSLRKWLSEFLSKIKLQNPGLHISPSSLSLTTRKIISARKHPNSISLDKDQGRRLSSGHHGHDDDFSKHDRHQNDEAATLADIDRFLFENFNSLYGNDANSESDDGLKKNDDQEEQPLEAGILLDPPGFFNTPPDLCGSHRFFVSSGSSSSLIEDAKTHGESASTSTSKTVANDGMVLPGQDYIVTLTAAPTNPYEDFRRSMKQVIETRVKENRSVDWDFIEELLLCYLRLNEKQQHKYILGAFVDLILVLRRNSSNEA